MTPARPQPKSPLIRKKQKAPLLGKKKAHDPKGSPQILFGQYFCKSDFGEWLGYFHVFAQKHSNSGNYDVSKEWHILRPFDPHFENTKATRRLCEKRFRGWFFFSWADIFASGRKVKILAQGKNQARNSFSQRQPMIFIFSKYPSRLLSMCHSKEKAKLALFAIFDAKT